MTHQEALNGLASERYLLDEMTEVERFEFEAHYFDCAECADEVRRGDMIRQEARRGAPTVATSTEAVRPAVVLTSPKWWRKPMTVAPWAVAATLALVVGYQSTGTNRLVSQSIEPVMLRGATRGAGTTVTVKNNQQFVALSADLLTPPQSSSLSYDILDANRAVVTSGQSAVPSSGAPLMLLVPVAEFTQPGRYTLNLRDGDQKTVVGEYEFEVSY